MYRYFSGFAIIIVIFFSSISLFAQSPTSTNEEFGKRAAKIPQSPADTGIEFDEYRLEKASHDYFNAARFSGTNTGKSMKQLETESYNAVRNMENKMAFKSLGSAAWQPIAGDQDGHVSGRVRGIAFDPTSNVVYIAAATGGIWKTPDISAQPIQWIDLSDRLPTCNFGSIAVDPKRPNIVYAGTGESQGDNYLSSAEPNAYNGEGLYRSLDGGLNWSLVDTTTGTNGEGSFCSEIIIDPVNTDTIYVATGSNFILKSYDGGTTWKKVAVGVTTLSIALDPLNKNNLYTSGFGSIYRSVDYGDTWTKCVTGLPTNGQRISVAVAPSSTNTVYACIGAGSSGTGVNTVSNPILGIWASDDYGVTWRKQYQFDGNANKNDPKNQNPLGIQQQWCNAITVHPTNPKRIFVGGLDIYNSNDSGKTFNKLTDWTTTITSGNFVHADIHTLVFNGTTLYACTDGGIASTTSFSGWNTSINQGIATLQFVGVDANKEFTYVTGGCQDNSTNRAGITSTEFHQTIGGDGGHGWVSQEQGKVAYTTYVYTNFKQSLDSAKTWGPNLIQPTMGVGLEGSPFYTVYDCNADGSVIALGGNTHVWVSTSGGTDGFITKSSVAIPNSYAIHVAPFDQTGSIIWAASGASIYHTDDQGATWTKQTTALSSTITGITSDPNNASNVYLCTTSGKHFFKSNDGGVTFTTPATNFPNIPCWCIARHPTDGRLFIGTEKGVFWSADDGVTWEPLMNGLPYCIVTQLRVRGTNNDKLLAGTYGRGMFWLDLTTVFGVNQSSTILQPLTLNPVFPNPIVSENATLGFTLKDPGLATVTLQDLLGRELRILEKAYYDAGNHQISLATSGLSAGTYFIQLTENGKSVSEKIVLN